MRGVLLCPLPLRFPQEKKSQTLRSGDLGGHKPPLMILPSYTSCSELSEFSAVYRVALLSSHTVFSSSVSSWKIYPNIYLICRTEVTVLG